MKIPKVSLILFLLILFNVDLKAQSVALWSHAFPEFEGMRSMHAQEWGEDTIAVLALQFESWSRVGLSVVRMDGNSGAVIDSAVVDLDWPYSGWLDMEAMHFTDSLIFVLLNGTNEEAGLTCIGKDLSVRWQAVTAQPDHSNATAGTMTVDEANELIYVFGYDYLNLVFDVYDFGGTNLLSDSIPNPEALAPYQTYLINDTLYLASDNHQDVIPSNNDLVTIRQFDLSGNEVGGWEHRSFYNVARIRNFQTDGNLFWLDVYESGLSPSANNILWSSIINRNGDTVTDISLDFFSDLSQEEYFINSELTAHGNVGLFHADSVGQQVKIVRLPLPPIAYLGGIDTLQRIGLKDRTPTMAYNPNTEVFAIFEEGINTIYVSFIEVDQFDAVETSTPSGLFDIEQSPQFCFPYQGGFLLFSPRFLDTPVFSLIESGLTSGVSANAVVNQFSISPNPIGDANSLLLEGELLCHFETATAKFYTLSGQLIGEADVRKNANCEAEVPLPFTVKPDGLFVLTIETEQSRQSVILAR